MAGTIHHRHQSILPGQHDRLAQFPNHSRTGAGKVKGPMNKFSRGHTVVELMVALLLASIVSIGALALYVNQTGMIKSETQRDTAAMENHRAFEKLAQLLRHAEVNSLNISFNQGGLNEIYTIQKENDDISIQFSIPKGFPIWPNDQAPYDKNKILIRWSNHDGDDNNFSIRLANAETVDILPNLLKPIAGGGSTQDPKIINLDFWPLSGNQNPLNASDAKADGGYLLRLASRTGIADNTYVNDNAPSGPLRHFRTHTVAAVIAPRN